MDVSIIIPIYNVGTYLKYSVGSILRQTFKGTFEIILVNDGSTDDTLDYAKKMEQKDSRVKVISKKNGGVSSARNAGLNVARGDFVLFLDADDIMTSDAIDRLFNNMKEDASLVCSPYYRITSYNQVIPILDYSISYFDNISVIRNVLREKFEMGVCSKLFRREKIGDLRFVEGRAINEDKYFLIKYLLNNSGIVVYINAYLYGYYHRIGSASKSGFSIKHLDILYFSRKIEQDVCLFPQLCMDSKYNNIVAHLSVLKRIIRSKALYKNYKLFRKIRKDTLLMVTGIPQKEIGRHKMEIISLYFGTVIYAICVKIFDFLKRS